MGMLLAGGLAAETAIVESRSEGRITVKGRGEVLLMDFRTASIEKWKVTKATLMLHIDEGAPPRMVHVSTVPSRWTEDNPQKAASGLFKESRRFLVTEQQQGWISIDLTPAYVEALASGKSHGLAVEEEGFRLHGRKPPQFSFSMLVEGSRLD
jgi:hypothetical protein